MHYRTMHSDYRPGAIPYQDVILVYYRNKKQKQKLVDVVKLFIAERFGQIEYTTDF